MMELVEFEPVAVQLTFDYDSLDSYTRTRLQDLAERGHTHLRRTREEIIAFGFVLIEAKELLQHGQFRDWTSAEFGIPDSTITYAMRRAKETIAEPENVNVSILPDNAIEQPVEPVEEVEEVRIIRTKEDKRKDVENFFAEFPHLHALSNREIGKRCGVDEKTVRNIRKELFPEPEPVIEVESEPEPETMEAPAQVQELDHASDEHVTSHSDPIEDITLEVEAKPEPEIPAVSGKIEASDDVRQARELKRQQVQERNASLRENGVALPVDTYACIVIDPPWQMQKIERDLYPNQIDFDYPTMTEEELKAFDLPKLASDDCHLYLWTTQKHLPVALRLAEHWGFKYQCLMTWVKNVGFTPYSWMYSTEHVLFCTRGNLPLLRQGMRLDFSAKRREHSRKPDEFYDIVREVSPWPRIDVFSREKRDGFKQFGNEADKYV